VFSNIIFAQKKDFNLDFEKLLNGKPIGWNNGGSKNYKALIDSNIAKQGKNSATIEYNGDQPHFGSWLYTIPAEYKGEKVKLRGFIKTENVSEGYAGLWLRVDPKIAFDNMQDRGIKGTSDWKEYEIELELKSTKATNIVFGGLLVGKGKMWIDNLEITIDGKPLSRVPAKGLLPADKDNEFDKGSNITISHLNENRINKLELLGFVWGFLKYHHPEIAKGNFNMDYELFRFLPSYLKLDNTKKRDEALISWINSFGEIQSCKKCKETPENAFLKPDLSWIESGNFSKKLKDKLLYLYKNRNEGKNYYVGMHKKVGNPEFKHERQYLNMSYPDEGFRLLSLYKYWNMIHYFFPNRHLIDKDWNIVLKEYIPKFLNAKNELEYELALVQIIGDIKDTHANIWRGHEAIYVWKGENYPPVDVRFIENKLLVVNFYNQEHRDKINLKEGDIITKINGKLVEELVKEKLPFYPASNYPTQLRNISIDILRSNEDKLTINFIRSKEEQPLELPLFNVKDLNYYYWYPPLKEDEKSYKLLDGNIGYITLQNIKQEDIKEIRKQFLNTKGIVVDIRNYPSAFMPFLLGSYFNSKGRPFVKFTNGNINNPGEFTYGRDLMIPSKGKTYKGKVVLLVNELTQSSAEYTTMGLKTGDDVTVIGSTTAGADGNVSKFYLPGGIMTYISGIGVLYPDGTETQRVGIVPDIEAKPTIKGIKEGRDELLAKAMEIINGN